MISFILEESAKISNLEESRGMGSRIECINNWFSFRSMRKDINFNRKEFYNMFRLYYNNNGNVV